MIFKAFVLLLYFTLSLLAKDDIQTINIDEEFKNLNSSSYTLHFIDKNSTMSIEEVAKQKKKLFKKMPRSSYNFTENTVYSWIQLQNHTDKLQNIVGENPWPGVDFIDIYFFKGDKQIAHLKRGDANKQKYRELLYGNSTFHAALKPQESLDILVKYRSFGAIKTTFLLHSPQEFIKSALFSSRMYAFFFGVLIALIIYNFSLYFSIKDRVFLYYCLYGVFNIILISTTNGYLYELDIGLYGDSISLIGTLAANFMVVALIVMIASLFELKSKLRWLYVLNIFVASLFALFSVANIFTILDRQSYPFLNILDNYILNYLYFLAIFTLSVDAIYGVYKKLAGSYFVFVGLAIYFVGAYIFLGYINGKFEYSFFTNRANVFAILADMIFISIALSQKVSILKKENEKNRLLLFQKSRFDTIGNTLSGVIHQLKLH
ncbi:MAG: 7TMR-DISM family protein [Campylobacterota bacterium]